MTNWRCLLASLALAACVAAPLMAQEPESKVQALRTKEGLTDEDRAAIRDWIGKRVADIVANDAIGAQSAFTQLRDGFNGTRDYKETYVAGCLESIGSAYKKADVIPGARLITLLSTLNDARTLPILLESLQDDRAAVRAAAAIVLRYLRPKLVAEADAYNRTLSALKEAAKKETSRETLELIYRALNFAELQPAPDLHANAAALLDVLEERVKQFAGQAVRAEGAETVALDAGDALRKSMDDAERKRYEVVLAKTLHYSVGRYTGGESPLALVQDKSASPDAIALRNAIEIMIKQSEQQLTELLGLNPPPHVADMMTRARKDERANLVEMVNEMNRWAATFKEKLGVDFAPLNEPPEATTKPAPPPKPPKPKP